MKLYVSLLVALYLYSGFKVLMGGTKRDFYNLMLGVVMYFPVFGRILGYW